MSKLLSPTSNDAPLVSDLADVLRKQKEQARQEREALLAIDWRVEYDPQDEHGEIVISLLDVDADDDGRPANYGESVIEGNFTVIDGDQCQAIADLIGAAPAMYRALGIAARALQRTAKENPEHNAALGEILDAMALARGENPWQEYEQ